MFLHEHPQAATSWQEDAVQDLLSAPGVGRVSADQCQYGAEVLYGHLMGRPIRKATGFMSNGPKILDELTRRCSGKLGRCSRPKGGEHVICTGRVASDAARYPLGLCKAILRGISRELMERGIIKIGEVGLHSVDDEDSHEHGPRSKQEGYSGKYRDDISGQILKDALVHEAR